MPVDLAAIRWHLLRSYRVGDGATNLHYALQAACRDIAALVAEVERLRSENDRMANMYESDVRAQQADREID